MYRTSLISLTAIVTAATTAVKVNAQSAPKKFSFGPAIEINDQGASFGIQGKIRVAPRFAVRPIVLFGYKPNVEATVTNGGQQTSGSPLTLLLLNKLICSSWNFVRLLLLPVVFA